MRAIAYLRVSSPGQVENESLPAQEQAAKNYCKAKGYRFLRVYADKGISGMSDQNRDALQEVKQDAKAGQFELFWSELFRDLEEQCSTLSIMKSSSVTITFG